MKKLIIILISLILTKTSNSQCENDTISPWFINFQHEVTISCSDDISIVIPTIADNCDENVELFYIEDIIPGECDNSQTITRIYRPFDDSGNSIVETQIIHIVDETPPIFEPLYTSIVNCGDVIQFTQPIVTDNCSWFSLMYQDIIDTSDCQTTYTRIWTAQDQCDNVSNATETLIVMDMLSPIITGDIYITLQEDANLDSTFISVVDDHSSVIITYTDTEVSGNNIIRDYVATDACGNSSTFEQIIHIDIENSRRVAICHNLGNGNWITIWVAQPAVNAHLNHGDYLGPCDENLQNQFLPNYQLEKDKNGKFIKKVRMK